MTAKRIAQIRNPPAVHHDPDVKFYVYIFAALLLLTLATVLVSYWHLPKGPAITLGLVIATTKAALVAAFFMHLKTERTLIYYFLGVTAVCLFILFVLPITDSQDTKQVRISAPASEEEAH